MTSSRCESMISLNGNMVQSSMTASMLSLSGINSTTLRDSDLMNKTDTDRNEFVFCLTRNSMINNRELMTAIQYLNPEYTIADNEEDLAVYAEDRRKYIFVCDTFSGELFSLLRKKSCRICGPPLLIYIHNAHRSLPHSSRPLFNGSMFGVAVCFTGFAEKKEALGGLADMVHFMGGSVRRDFSGRITHVVAYAAKGQKYKAAVNLGKNIMTEKWVTEAWENRHESGFKATQSPFAEQFQMKPFEGLKLSFLGFPPDETEHMQETTVQQGGQYFDVGASGCTHLVIEDDYPSVLPSEVSQILVVKREWFWRSIQLDACAEESLYFFVGEQGTPLGIGPRVRVGKRKSDLLVDLLSPNSPLFANKRRSGLSAVSTDFESSLGDSLSPSAFVSPEFAVKSSTVRQPLTARKLTCLELQQTERNYVHVLQMVITNFKEPLEQSGDERGGALLSPGEIKTIFGALPDLLSVHQLLLASLDSLVNDWNEEQLIGKVIIDCAEGMMKAYPRFINYFHTIKETIAKFDKERPRFHAFLKICQHNPDLGRQSLTDLLIRPVQRVPSICLLLKDILRNTPEANPDHQCLTEALQAVEKVLTVMNEDKRRTEHRFEMFDIIGVIDNCPPYILSAHRTLVSKAEVQECAEGGVTKCDSLQMFLFNDSLEIAKRRNKMNNSVSTKSPAMIMNRGQAKPYKHREFIKLSLLKSIVDIKDDGEFYDMFGLIYFSSIESKDVLGVYKLLGGVTKDEWMAKIVKCLSETKCTADSENYLVSIDASELIDRNDVPTHKEKTGNMARFNRKIKKVARAFSLSKTPKLQQQSNTTLRRAISGITPSSTSCGDDPSFTTPTTPTTPSSREYSLVEMLTGNEKK